MKQYLRYLILGILLLSALSVAVFVFVANDDARVSAVGTLSSIVSILSSLLLFGISLFAYQKFNSSQRTIDKKAEKVFELLRLLREIRLTAVHSISDVEHSESFNIRPLNIKKPKEPLAKSIFNDKSKEDNPQYFDESMLGVYKDLISLSEDIFMPKSISKKIQDGFDIEGIFSISTTPYEDVKNYELVIYADRVRESKLSLYTSVLNGRPTPKKVLSSFNSKPVNVDKFIGDIRSVNKLARKWIKENSPYTIDDLNI